MTVSEIRALFAVASRPEVASLSVGMPYLPAYRWTRYPMTSPNWWPPKA